MAKIIFITSRFPYPLDKGDKLRVFFQLKHLAEDHEIHLIAINETKVSKEQLVQVSPFCKSIHHFILPVYKRVLGMMQSPFTKLPFQVAYFYNPRIKRQISDLVHRIKPDIIHCHLIRTTEYVKDIQGFRKSLDYMDAFGMGMERRESIEKNWLKRWIIGYEKNLVYRYEENMLNHFDRFCIISEQDKHFIKGSWRTNIAVIPNGVDFEMFYPRAENKKYDLVFMGNLGYPPNVHAIQLLVNEILPLIRNKKVEIQLLLAGVGAGSVVRALQSDHVHLIEQFNDISDSMAMSRIMIAPMTISIGLQNKVIQAMAMGIPCVVSKLSNNAINAPHGEAIIEAQTPEEFAKNIVDLLENKTKANTIGQQAIRFVHENFSWDQQNRLLCQLMFS